MNILEEYLIKHRAKLTWWQRILKTLIWEPQFYIEDIIERARYRRYVKLYLWFDCLPPDEKDIDAVTNSLSKIWGTPEEDAAWKDL